MKTQTQQMQQLVDDIAEKASEGRKIRGQIAALQWKEGTASEVAKLRAQRDPSGQRCVGKRALAAFRRPETGPERYALWDEKRSVGREARIHLLVLGLLRGVSYERIERTCVVEDRPSARTLRRVLQSYGVEMTEETIQGWFDGAVVAPLARAA